MTAGARGQSPCPQKRRLTNQHAMSMLDVGDGVGRAQPVGDEDLARGHTEPGPEDVGVQLLYFNVSSALQQINTLLNLGLGC
uniref:Uncharacterized protein n=1 Tax=Oryza barthii TaxID=65489 RepID=A0A0D3G9I9_9ORYZ